MPELLTGIVTFLFSDIEGSTRIARLQGPHWPALLGRHQELLRAAFRASGGREVGTEGDSFFVAFPTPAGALAAAVAAQRALAAEPWPADAEVRVRIGMHTGEASIAADGYVGLHVHRASRIASVGHGGQVVLSDATRGLLDDVPEGVSLRDLGEHRLKDFDQPEHLWQATIDGLPQEFPSIRSLDVVPNNLPSRLTTFLGREREIAQVRTLLETHRLLTLTGPGGTGKTRLSLEVAARSVPRFPDGVFFVELAAIRDPDLVATTIAKALGLPDRGGSLTGVERLIDHIGDGRVLLVLDNFEQVSAAAPAIGELLATAPNLAVLTSSRQVLRVAGEQEFPVPPLGLPDPANLPSLSQLSQYEAVALFIERARAVKPEFEVTNENAPAVAEICVRLDGLPLAIELAAARIRVLTPQAMLGRLEHRLGLLAAGSRDLPERQQTLRGAIAWSHDMLDEQDRAMFAGFAVFAGGADFEAIEQICGETIDVDPLDVVESLVEKSLVRQTEGIDGQPRFGMLETIREFAVEQAIAAGTWDGLQERHAAHFLAVAGSAAGMVMGSSKREVLDRLEQEHDNLRAAMAWAIERGAAETALRLSASMWRFWQMRGHLPEGLGLIRRALELDRATDYPSLRANALDAAAGLAYWLAELEVARGDYEAEIALRRELGDRRGLAEALYSISFTWSIVSGQERSNATQAAGYVNEALGIFQELGDDGGVARCEWALANATLGTGTTEEALEHGRAALELFERIDDRFMVGWARYTMGLGNLLLDVGADGGRPDSLVEAADWLRKALEVFADAQDVSGYTLVLDGFAAAAHRLGDLDRAAQLSGAVARLERTSGTGLNLWSRDLLGFEPETLRTDARTSAAWAQGEAMSSDEAVAYALTR